jgi:hypothetical protein
MWKGEFPAAYLEDISRKTGRELSFNQYIEMLNQVLTQNQDEKNKVAVKGNKHLFIDLMGY